MTRPLTLSLSAVLAAALLAGCNDNSAPGNDRGAQSAEPNPAARPAPPGEAVREAAVPRVYPASMTDQEIARIVDPDSACSFSYTAVGFPVLAVAAEAGGPATGVVKLNDKLVELTGASAIPQSELLDGVSLTAEGVRAEITPVADQGEGPDGGVRREADLVFVIEQGAGHEVGFRGYYACPPAAG